MAKVNKQFVFDLMSEIRNNPRRRKAITSSMLNLDKIHKAVAQGKASNEELRQEQAKLVIASGFNFGLLMPHVFPRYPYENPLELTSRPFMFVMMGMAPKSVVVLKAGRQIGKCADKDTEVTTEKGKITLGAIFESGIPCS